MEAINKCVENGVADLEKKGFSKNDIKGLGEHFRFLSTKL